MTGFRMKAALQEEEALLDPGVIQAQKDPFGTKEVQRRSKQGCAVLLGRGTNAALILLSLEERGQERMCKRESAKAYKKEKRDLILFKSKEVSEEGIFLKSQDMREVREVLFEGGREKGSMESTPLGGHQKESKGQKEREETREHPGKDGSGALPKIRRHGAAPLDLGILQGPESGEQLPRSVLEAGPKEDLRKTKRGENTTHQENRAHSVLRERGQEGAHRGDPGARERDSDHFWLFQGKASKSGALLCNASNFRSCA